MPSLVDWHVPPEVEPEPQHYDYDLDAALNAVVGLRATAPEDAFTAGVLGTERSGHGVVIDKSGVVLTIGYLVTEAEEIWLSTGDGRAVPATAIGHDQETGFGLVQALGKLNLPALPLGSSADVEIAAHAVAAGAGGRKHSVATRIAAKQEFAGYWEYVLDEAIFTHPAHPYWGGTALIGGGGKLLGIGSLQLQSAPSGQTPVVDSSDEDDDDETSGASLNMFVPIDLLKPIYNDLMTTGRVDRPLRPWLGFYATEMDGQVVVAGLAGKGPAARAGLTAGDIVLSVAGAKVTALAELFRKIWSLGHAGVGVPMTILREGRVMEIRVTSSDRERFLKKPRLH